VPRGTDIAQSRCPLLQHMRELVREQGLAARRVRIKPAGAKNDVPAPRVRPGVQPIRRRGGRRIGVDDNVGQWRSEGPLQRLSDRRGKRTAELGIAFVGYSRE
jgi:hypothetical protein